MLPCWDNDYLIIAQNSKLFSFYDKLYFRPSLQYLYSSNILKHHISRYGDSHYKVKMVVRRPKL